jgi:hypothetical protein
MKLLRILTVEFLVVAAIYSREAIFFEAFVALTVLVLIEISALFKEKQKLPLLCVGSLSLGFILLRVLPNDSGSRGLAFMIALVLWLPAAAIYLPFCIREVLPSQSKKAPIQPPQTTTGSSAPDRV